MRCPGALAMSPLSGGRESLYQLIDFRLGVVAMRADTDPPGALVDDDALVPALAHELPQVGVWDGQRHNPGLLFGPPAAIHFQARLLGPCTQMVRQLQNPIPDGR